MKALDRMFGQGRVRVQAQWLNLRNMTEKQYKNYKSM